MTEDEKKIEFMKQVGLLISKLFSTADYLLDYPFTARSLFDNNQ